MPSWRTLIEKDHLGAWDLIDPKTDKPRDYTLVISKVETKLLKTKEQPKGKRKAVITFTKAKKQFVANPTNCQTIASMYGEDYTGWVGKAVTLYYAMTRDPGGRGQVPCIRVRTRVPQTGVADEIPDVPVDENIRKQQDEAFDRSDDAPPNPDEDGR